MKLSFSISAFLFFVLGLFYFQDSLSAQNENVVAALYWNGSGNASWNAPGNWTDYGPTDDFPPGLAVSTTNEVAPNNLYTDSNMLNNPQSLSFYVFFDDRGSNQTNIAINSGRNNAAVFGTTAVPPYSYDLDPNSIDISQIKFTNRPEGNVTPSYTITLSGANLAADTLSNTSDADQTFIVPAGKQLVSVNSCENITINNLGTLNVRPTNSTLTNNATATNARGVSIPTLMNDAGTTIVNNGGATWLMNGASNGSIRNKVSNGIPGYTGLVNGSIDGSMVSLGFDVTSQSNGFAFLANGTLYTREVTTLTLYLDSMSTYSSDERVLIYGLTNGLINGGGLTCEIKDLNGNPLTGATVELNTTPGADPVTLPQGVEVPESLGGGAALGLVYPLLRATITYGTSSVSSALSEIDRQSTQTIALSATKGLEKMGTAIQTIFGAVSQMSRNWAPSTTGQSQGRSSGSSQTPKNELFRAPSLTHSYLNNTEGMMGVTAQETLDRFAPLRTEKTGVWAQPFGQMVSQDPSRGNLGFDSKTAGILFGMDHKVSPKLIVGGGFGSSNSTAEVRSNGSKTQVVSHFASIFSSWMEEDWYLEGFLTASRNRFRMGRKISPSVVADNRHKGYQLMPSLGAGYKIDFGNDCFLTPALTTTVIYGHEDKYAETGAGNNNQNINARWSSLWRNEAGISLSSLEKSESYTASHSIGLKMIVMTPLKKGHITGTTGGNGFAINSNDQTDVYAGLNLSSELRFDDDWFISGNYAGEFGSGLKAHEVALRLGKRF